eukprot:881622-Prymnesium_polylepis.1
MLHCIERPTPSRPRCNRLRRPPWNGAASSQTPGVRACPCAAAPSRRPWRSPPPPRPQPRPPWPPPRPPP